MPVTSAQCISLRNCREQFCLLNRLCLENAKTPPAFRQKQHLRPNRGGKSTEDLHKKAAKVPKNSAKPCILLVFLPKWPKRPFFFNNKATSGRARSGRTVDKRPQKMPGRRHTAAVSVSRPGNAGKFCAYSIVFSQKQEKRPYFFAKAGTYDHGSSSLR